MTPAHKPDKPPASEDFLTRAGPDRARPARGGDDAARELAVAMARLFRDDKCSDVVVLDVRGASPLTDYLVIASGTSERQMRSVLDHATELAESMDAEPYAVTRDSGTLWLVADFVDVVAHLFEPNTRAHYDLEMLWGDAPRIAWERDHGT
jgi:ribosome-associated protein